MTIADYQAQTAANLKKLQDIKLDLSVLDSLEEQEELEDIPPAPSPRSNWFSLIAVAAIAAGFGLFAGLLHS